MSRKNELAWQVVTFKDPQSKTAYAEVRRAQAQLKKAKEKLEAILKPRAQKIGGKDFTPVFAYKWGRVSVGFKPIEDDSPTGDNVLEL